VEDGQPRHPKQRPRSQGQVDALVTGGNRNRYPLRRVKFEAAAARLMGLPHVEGTVSIDGSVGARVQLPPGRSPPLWS
jgi:hypothetical protein